MWHLVQNLSNYMMFEVLEDSWVALNRRLDAAKDLDALVEAHDKYLLTIRHKALLSAELLDVVEQLHCVLDTIIAFCATTDTLFTDAFAEMSRLQAVEREAEARSAAGQWGRDDGDDEARWGEECICGVAVRTLMRLKTLGADFGAAFDQLVTLLRETSSGTEVLRFLMFRLDFNGYHGMA